MSKNSGDSEAVDTAIKTIEILKRAGAYNAAPLSEGVSDK